MQPRSGEVYIVNQSTRPSPGPQSVDTHVPQTDCCTLEPITPQMVASMDLEALAHHCLLEHERFYHSQPHDTRFAYELFRRAIVERNQAAWDHLYRHYAPQITCWIKRQRIYADYHEASDILVNETFLRFYQAIPAERFAAFATLGALLRYLHRCALCAVIDSGRAYTRAELLHKDACAAQPARPCASDQEAIARVQAIELWRYIAARVTSDAERVVLVSDFVLGMKPRAIYRLHRDLFPSVAAVYKVKHNLLERLRRDPPGKREDW
jgi:hypothetical protein